MADNLPNVPGGALPPKKETGKVQPKKETVRITLPPKPSTAPTIKMPTLPPGGPTAASTPGTVAPTLSTSVPATTAAPPLSRAAAAPSSAGKPSPAKRPVSPVPAVDAISGIDKMLVLAAGVAGLIAVVVVGWLAFVLRTN